MEVSGCSLGDQSWKGYRLSLCFPAHTICGTHLSFSLVGTRSCLTRIKAFGV